MENWQHSSSEQPLPAGALTVPLLFIMGNVVTKCTLISVCLWGISHEGVKQVNSHSKDCIFTILILLAFQKRGTYYTPTRDVEQPIPPTANILTVFVGLLMSENYLVLF